jgi:maltose alpha-D-glucosyltransferase/alpha-amylase
VLPGYISERRWFGSKSRKLKGVRIVDFVAMPLPASIAYVTFVQIDFVEGDSETYLLPVTLVSPDRADDMRHWTPHALIAALTSRQWGSQGVLIDSTYDVDFMSALLETLRARRRLRGTGEIRANTTRELRSILQKDSPDSNWLQPGNIRAEQSNSSITFGDKLILKLFRRVEPGVNPDLEVGRYLTEQGFEHTPSVAGWLDYRRPNGETATLGILHGFVANEGDAWQFTGDVLRRYFEQSAASSISLEVPATLNAEELLKRMHEAPPEELHESFDTYLDAARALGERTAQLHLALANGPGTAFAPEPFTTLYQRSVYQRMRGLSGNVIPALARRLSVLPEEQRELAQRVVDLEPEIVRRFRFIIERQLGGVRIRCHGDFHLGQVLHTGRDFSIIDFEGEPARALGERRLKRSPLTDVAGMLRSFHYAAYATFFDAQRTGLIRSEDAPSLDQWARFWVTWVSAYYLRGYLEVPGVGSILPKSDADLQILLDASVLEKAIYELGYELNNRPDWLPIPLNGILQIFGGTE